MMLRFHTQTGGATLTAQQPENNIVRTALQALAAVLGGTQSLHTNSMDEALAPAHREGRSRSRCARSRSSPTRAASADVVDPLGGSYYIEALTDRARGRGEGVHRDDRRHGRRAGRASSRASSSARSRRRPTATRREVEDEGARHRRRERLQDAGRAGRNAASSTRRSASGRRRSCGSCAPTATTPPSDASLANLDAAARGSDNLVPIMVECVENRATLGEISHASASVWGEYQPQVII